MTLSNKRLEKLTQEGRNVEVAISGDEDLGPLKPPPGVWKNTIALHGFGFNMIALPMSDADPNRYRLLMNLNVSLLGHDRHRVFQYVNHKISGD